VTSFISSSPKYLSDGATKTPIRFLSVPQILISCLACANHKNPVFSNSFRLIKRILAKFPYFMQIHSKFYVSRFRRAPTSSSNIFETPMIKDDFPRRFIPTANLCRVGERLRKYLKAINKFSFDFAFMAGRRRFIFMTRRH
jgi:hypothetical protein